MTGRASIPGLHPPLAYSRWCYAHSCLYRTASSMYSEAQASVHTVYRFVRYYALSLIAAILVCRYGPYPEGSWFEPVPAAKKATKLGVSPSGAEGI